MAVTIEQVPMWGVGQGVGHAVEGYHDYFMLTACGIMTNTLRETPARPRRICRKCREALKSATLTGEAHA